MPPPTPYQHTPPPPHDRTPSTKRKQRDDHEDDTDDSAVDPRDVTDAEVEEFYAILRRVRRVAHPTARLRPPAAAPTWSPAFAWDDFARDDGVGDGTLTAPPVSEAEKDAAPRALDLNAEPEPEGDSGGDEATIN